MSRRRQVSDEEQALWQAITRSVVPLKRRRKHAAPPKVAAEPKQKPPSRLPTASMHAVAVVPKPAPKPTPKEPALAPIDRRSKQKLARGTQAIDARIDLHGRTQDEAHVVLLRFLHRAQSQWCEDRAGDHRQGRPLRQRTRRAQAAGADVARAAGIPRPGRRFRRRRHRPRRRRRALCAGAAGQKRRLDRIPRSGLSPPLIPA